MARWRMGDALAGDGATRRAFMRTDLYLALGVDPSASPEQIRAAYRHWGKQLQPEPDTTPSEPMRELQDAYSVLGNPPRRRAYDQQRRDETRAAQDRPEAEPFRALAPEPAPDFELLEPAATAHPSFEELFDRFWSNFDLVTRPKAERLESLTAEICLTPEQARTGGEVRVMIPARAQCPACGGHGALGLYQCWRCGGQGAITADYPLHIAYPAGVVNEHVVRVPLNRFGIGNFYLTVRLCVTSES